MPRKLPEDLQAWIEARQRRHRANHHHEPQKAPLPQFVEHLYLERLGRERPEVVRSIKERARADEARRAARKEARRRARAEGHCAPPRGS